MEFKEFQKIPRLNRECVITEKLDGTNASVWIIPGEEMEGKPWVPDLDPFLYYHAQTNMFVAAGSRNRWVKPGKNDNYGFASWVKTNAEDLLKLGPGTHYGEWWGYAIQRGYALAEKRFSLFNVGRWVDVHMNPGRIDASPDYQFAPFCCHVVPVLYRGPFDTQIVNTTLRSMEVFGSMAAPGFPDAEGIIVYHTASNHLYKATIKGDEAGKHAEAHPKKEPRVRPQKNPNIGGRRKEQLAFEGPDRRKQDGRQEASGNARTSAGTD